MKKALAILMALAMIVPAVFAEDAAAEEKVTYGNEAAVTVEGNATLSWGMNLETEAHGFKNAAEWKIVIPLLAKQTFAHKGEGDNFAEISIVDAQYGIQGDHDGDTAFTAGDKKIDKVTAKLNFGPVYVTVYDKPGFKTNNAKIWDPIKADGYNDDGKEGKTWNFEPGFDGWGTKIGYKTETFDIGAKVGSNNTYEAAGTAATADTWKWVEDDDDDDPETAPTRTWTKVLGTAATKAADSQYAFGVDASFKPSDMIDLSATFNYATWARTTKASDATDYKKGIMSIGAKAVAKPVEGLDLTIGFDGGNDAVADGKDAFAWDALASAKFKFVEAGAYLASAGTPFQGNKVTRDANEIPTKTESVMGAAAYGKLTDGDFVENLDAWFTFMAYGFGSDSGVDVLPMAIGTGANYKYAMNDVNYIKPFFEFFANNTFYAGGVTLADQKKEAEKYAYACNVGVEYGLFTNTTLTAKYATGATKDNNLIGPVKVDAKSDNGLVTFACKVTY